MGVTKAAHRRYLAFQMRNKTSKDSSFSGRSLDGIVSNRYFFLTHLRKQSALDIAKRSFRKAEIFFRFAKRLLKRITPDIAPRKMLYGSLIGGVTFGMVTMAFMEHYLGSGVFARSSGAAEVAPVVVAESLDKTNREEKTYAVSDDVFFEYFSEAEESQYEANIREMVKGYPIENMLPDIFKQDHMVASFLIGIAKKESNWGKRIPVLNDQDCFNYWGYRGVRRMMGTGGHTCFNSRKDAVETVANRLHTLINSQKLDTPEKLIVWKCGFSCRGHSRESVLKWISDVDMYFEQANNENM